MFLFTLLIFYFAMSNAEKSSKKTDDVEKGSQKTDHTEKDSQKTDHTEKGSDKILKDAKFWKTVDLRKLEVPKGVHDIGQDYVIDNMEIVTEKSVEIDGTKLFYRDAQPRGPDSGQVPIQQ